MADTARFWPNQPDSARIEADSARIEPHRREWSRVGTNQAESARIQEKKKKTQTRTDARATASDTGAAPLVPRPCFLDEKLYFVYGVFYMVIYLPKYFLFLLLQNLIFPQFLFYAKSLH